MFPNNYNMRKVCLFFLLSIVFFIIDYQFGYAQYSRADWFNDKPYQDIVSSLSGYSGSSGSSRTSRSKSRRSKKDRNSNYSDYDYSAEIHRQAQLAIEAEMKKAAEAERIRKEEEFKADKAELQGSMRGYNSNNSFYGYSGGLKGVSNDGSLTSDPTDFSSGLKGIGNKSTSGERKSLYGSGLRDYSDDNSITDANSSTLRIEEASSKYNTINEDTPTNIKLEPSTRSNVGNSSNQTCSNTTQFRGNNASYSSSSTHTKSSNAKKTYLSYEYTRYVTINNPEAAYYTGPGSYYYSIDSSDNYEEPLIDRIEQRIDLWREEGRNKALTYIGDKLTGFARKTISAKSAMGVQAIKVLDVFKDIAGVYNVEKRIINRTLDATKKTIITGDSRYIDEVQPINKKEVNDQLDSYLDSKGLYLPNARKLDKKGQQVTLEVAEESIKKVPDLWISLKNRK